MKYVLLYNFFHAVVMKYIINFGSFLQYTLHFFSLVYHSIVLDGEYIHVTCQGVEVLMFIAWWTIEADENCAVNDIPENFSSVGFVF